MIDAVFRFQKPEPALRFFFEHSVQRGRVERNAKLRYA
jgi:hypothetical protein